MCNSLEIAHEIDVVLLANGNHKAVMEDSLDENRDLAGFPNVDLAGGSSGKAKNRREINVANDKIDGDRLCTNGNFFVRF